MKIKNVRTYKRVMNESQKKTWDKVIKVFGEEKEKRFYNVIAEMCKAYGLRKILPNTEEFLVAKTFFEKIMKSEKYLMESTQAGSVSGMTPALGMSAVYPSGYMNKRPVFSVDLKTIEKFLKVQDYKSDAISTKPKKEKKDEKENKSLPKKVKSNWINFLISPEESEDVKMALVKAKKESKGFFLEYGDLLVEIKNKE